MHLEELIGNDKIKQTFQNLIQQHTLSHSYLFVGIEGIGKFLFAKTLANMILCQEENKKPCGACKSCLALTDGNHPDLMQIEPEGKGIKIEQIRYMQEKIAEKPIVSNHKVYILREADTMTQEAQNCLLKTLEEPPSYAIILLIASNESKLLNTIKSRCIKIPFLPIEEKAIKEYMQKEKGITLSDNELAVCCGSLGKAIKMQEQAENHKELERIIQLLPKEDLATIIRQAEVLYKGKEEIMELLEYLLVVLYHTKDINLLNCIGYVEDTKKRLLANSNYDMSIDYLLMRMWEEVHEKYNRSKV